MDKITALFFFKVVKKSFFPWRRELFHRLKIRPHWSSACKNNGFSWHFKTTQFNNSMFHLTFKKSSVSKKLIGKSSRFQELANRLCMRTELPGSKTLFKKQAQEGMEKPIITLLWAGPLLSSGPASKLSVSSNSGSIAPSSQAAENQVFTSRAACVGIVAPLS